MVYSVVLWWLVTMLLLASKPLMARDPILDPHESISPQVEDSEGWVEEPTNVPPYPLEANLLEFNVVDQQGSRFRFFSDSASIETGKRDGVVRYTLVIRSRKGGDNVMFEAMHCAARQFKRSAWLTRRFRAATRRITSGFCAPHAEDRCERSGRRSSSCTGVPPPFSPVDGR